ncbi:MAG: ATP-binding protein [Anaerolineaceae bacterium]|nr:ATP-binding protein [Anaerolineaceae bacterium]
MEEHAEHNLEDIHSENSETAPEDNHKVRSLKHLIEIVTGKDTVEYTPTGESGLADNRPYPFLAIVGQQEMKLALLLNLINPSIGGVLLLGPRGTGKSTAIRSLVQLTPKVKRSLCYYGCTEEDIETGGIDMVCPDCAKRYAEGLPLTQTEDVHLVELPLNAEIEDVVGGIDERAMVHHRMRLKRGLLCQADRNILFIDEVNLLNDEIVNVILDAAALGAFTVRRGPISATYNARFSLIGSMNPEEGKLRPQIMDRFGLRILVNGLEDIEERWLAYQRVSQFKRSPSQVLVEYEQDTILAREEIIAAKNKLNEVVVPSDVGKIGLNLIHDMKITSLRAEITLFEAARAYAAADGRITVSIEDVAFVAPMALRMRQSKFINSFFEKHQKQDNHLSQLLESITSKPDGEPDDSA